MNEIVVIGAGIGGLAAAAHLAKRGADVTVLEAHVYPGGSAGTYVHKGYRFDAGATLGGGFAPGGPMDLVAERTGLRLPTRATLDRALTVHMPDGRAIPVWSDQRRWRARREHFGPESLPFWRWQEDTAERLWELALRLPPWPPAGMSEAHRLFGTLTAWSSDLPPAAIPGLVLDALRPASVHLPASAQRLRAFVDAQLLISAQANSRSARALYAAAALDLPRRGVAELEGGMGSLGEAMAAAVRSHGGRVLYRKRVSAIRRLGQGGYDIHIERRESMQARSIVANLPLANIRGLMSPPHARLDPWSSLPRDGWGAFVLHLGIDAALVPSGIGPHHQVLSGDTMAEGGSAFLSISPGWDSSRAPQGRRALTISTHTDLRSWWPGARPQPEEYRARVDRLTERLLERAEAVLPGVSASANPVMPGTPITFQRFTGRLKGWVGGYPQTSLFRFPRPRIGPNLWIVGDSVFPGQSTPAVALGGLRVAESVLTSLPISRRRWAPAAGAAGQGSR